MNLNKNEEKNETKITETLKTATNNFEI